MIHPSGLFEYEAEFTSDSFNETDVVLHGTSINDTDGNRLVGHNPMIRFWHDRLVLVAKEKAGANIRNTSFDIGNAVPLAAKPGDRLYLVRTGSGGFGLSLLRGGRLVLAIGAVTAVPLGTDVRVIAQPERSGISPRADAWLEFQVASERVELKQRAVRDIGNYQVYIERCWEDGIPGVDECVSMSVVSNQTMNIASLRSAILLGHSFTKMTRWDGTETFC
jgi:hypothetical protein